MHLPVRESEAGAHGLRRGAPPGGCTHGTANSGSLRDQPGGGCGCCSLRSRTPCCRPADHRVVTDNGADRRTVTDDRVALDLGRRPTRCRMRHQAAAMETDAPRRQVEQGADGPPERDQHQHRVLRLQRLSGASRLRGQRAGRLVGAENEGAGPPDAGPRQRGRLPALLPCVPCPRRFLLHTGRRRPTHRGGAAAPRVHRLWRYRADHRPTRPECDPGVLRHRSPRRTPTAVDGPRYSAPPRHCVLAGWSVPSQWGGPAVRLSSRARTYMRTYVRELCDHGDSDR